METELMPFVSEEQENIEPLPLLPKEIIEAYEEDKLVLLVGAGISRLVGCMGWTDLAKKLIKAVFSPATANQISNGSYSEKELISMAYEQAKHHNKTTEYWTEFENAIKSNGKNIHIYNDITSRWRKTSNKNI